MMNFTPVEIEMADICRQLAATAGREVSDVEAMVWLRCKGFVLFGSTWVGDDQCRQSLAEMQLKSGSGFDEQLPDWGGEGVAGL